MRVLITGAFGNLGLMCVEQALALGHDVRCFDIFSAKNKKIAKGYGRRVETVFGDIRDEEIVKRALSGVEAVIHNASLLPPLTETNVEFSREVNVAGTGRLIKLAGAEKVSMRFVFPSSVTVFGLPSIDEPARTIEDAIKPSDNYTSHKITCEEMLADSQLEWCVLRVGVSVDSRTLRTDYSTFKKLLQVRADNPLEYVHPKDVAFAMCQALVEKEAARKILLIGGGSDCQVTQYQFLGCAINACGLTLNPTIFGQEYFYTHWMNTEESERILRYQTVGFSDYEQEMKHRLRYIRWLLTPIRPVANKILPLVLKKIASEKW